MRGSVWLLFSAIDTSDDFYHQWTSETGADRAVRGRKRQHSHTNHPRQTHANSFPRLSLHSVRVSSHSIPQCAPSINSRRPDANPRDHHALLSSAAPPIPAAAQLYEPLAKAILRRRLTARIFPATGVLCVVTAGVLGVLGVAAGMWVGAVVPVLLVRKAFLTVMRTSAPSPFLLLQKSLAPLNTALRARTLHEWQAHLVPALAVLVLHAALDPTLPVLIRSRCASSLPTQFIRVDADAAAGNTTGRHTPLAALYVLRAALRMRSRAAQLILRSRVHSSLARQRGVPETGVLFAGMRPQMQRAARVECALNLRARPPRTGGVALGRYSPGFAHAELAESPSAWNACGVHTRLASNARQVPGSGTVRKSAGKSPRTRARRWPRSRASIPVFTSAQIGLWQVAGLVRNTSRKICLKCPQAELQVKAGKLESLPQTGSKPVNWDDLKRADSSGLLEPRVQLQLERRTAVKMNTSSTPFRNAIRPALLKSASQVSTWTRDLSSTPAWNVELVVKMNTSKNWKLTSDSSVLSDTHSGSSLGSIIRVYKEREDLGGSTLVELGLDGSWRQDMSTNLDRMD
ncbi:hypothetical protein FB451DRAFT_1166679 [Mycena latifolia]|nr:hypothetical protein FB451DRAFT_1166679 [Mycena latifolia]